MILSGGPSSVYEEGAPSLDPALLEAGVPVFGMCYGFQAMAQALGGTVAHTGLREYGATTASVSDTASTLFNGQPDDPVGVDVATATRCPRRPPGCGSPRPPPARRVAAFEDDERRLYGVQWHPEVMHSTVRPAGARELPLRGAGLDGDWTAANVVEELVGAIREQVGDARVLCAPVRRRRLLGGRGPGAAGRRRPADLRVRRPRPAAAGRGRAGREGLRRGDRRRPRRRRRPGAVPRRARRGLRPRGEAQDHRPRVHPGLRAGGARRRRLAPATTGTRSSSSSRARSTPTSSSPAAAPARPTSSRHHNVGGLPDDLQFKLVEPLRTLFKDEVRQVGLELGVPEGIVWRQPFPGPGLGIRIVGEVTAERLDVLRARRRDRPRGADRRPASTATSGSAPWCCSPTSARSASRATAAPTATRSCCARSPPRTR